MADLKSVDLIETGSQQLQEAKNPPKVVEREGSKRLVHVRTHEYFGVLSKAWKNDALSWDEVKSFLSQTEEQLGVLENIPEDFSFSMKEGEGGAGERRKVLNQTLTGLGVASIKVGEDTFLPNEIWDAVYYQAADEKTKKDYLYLKDARGKKIIKASEQIVKKIDKQQQRVIVAFEDGLLAEDIEPRSLIGEKILARDGVNSVRLNQRQKKAETGKVQVKNTLVLRAKLDRYDVITAFLNQRAEGRVGQEKPPEPGDRQLPGMITYREGEKILKVQGLSDDEVREIMLILEDVDIFKEKHKDELQGGFQGRVGWIAEASLRRMHEVWKETADVLQKDVASLLTWTSELGHGCMVSEWLSIPAVAEVLTWGELYQQRDPATDRPLPMKDLPAIEAELKKRAKERDIPSSKVDLAIFLSQILQLGYWTGRVGWKVRHTNEKFALLDMGAGLPVWSWEAFVDQSNLSQEEKAVFTPEKRKIFDYQIAQLNAYLVAMAMTGYTVEHLGRIPDEASQEDLLFLSEVGEAPLYQMLDDELIKVIAELEEIPFKEMKQNIQYSFLHREQYRWQFVYAYYSNFLGEKYQGVIGEEAVEKRYFNADSAEDRQALINYLTTSSAAITTLQEAGINPVNFGLITDDLIQMVCSDQNMVAVNNIREAFFNERSRKITLADLAAYSQQALANGGMARAQLLAAIVELVLREKRTWNLDMGVNNSKFSSPDLPREIREKGGYSADQIGVLVTAEYNRNDHMNTYRQYLELMARIHLHNEFYTGKDYVEKLSVKYSDLPRARANSLVNPWTILETSASIRAAMMLIGYWDAGYAHTGGRMVTDQEALYDQLDIDRIFHERFFPVIGAAQRVRKGRDGYIKWQKDICLRQRAKISAALARFYERQFFQQGASIQQIMSYKAGEGGKDIYTHCVPVIRNGRMELVMDTDPDFFVAQTKRYAEMFYFPASQAQLEQMNSQAKQKQLDEDHARQQIDGLVQLGFMRSWKNDKQQDVGLGDLFKAQFEVDGKMHVFPIEFFINMRQNIESIARTWAYAKGFTLPGMSPEIANRYFWSMAKTGRLEQVSPGSQKIWDDFCQEMIKGWLVDPSLPDSMIPQFYWEWKEMTQAALGIPEEGMEGLGARIRLGFRGARDIVVGKALEIFNREGSIWQRTLGRPGLRANMIARWQADPIPEALHEIKRNFGDKIVADFVTTLKRAEKEGLFLREKLEMRHQIEGAFRADQIDEHTYETLMNLVVNASYRPNLIKNITNPDYQIHKKWYTLQGFVTEKVVEIFAKMGETDIKNNLTAQWIFTYLNANPQGYAWAAAIAGVGGGIFAFTASAAPLTLLLGTLGSMQLLAMGISAGFRAVDYLVRKARRGRGGLFTSADPLIFEQEYLGQH